VPIRGTYLKVRKGREGLVVGNIYPVPDPELPFLGAHLTRTVDGSLLIGPTALLVAARDAYRLSKARLRDLAETVGWPGTWRMVSRHWRATGRELRNSVSARALVADAARMLPGLDASDVEPGPSGVRAQALGRDGRLIDDFLVEQIGAGIHVRNAPSPAATSSLALARLIADRALAA
jgi:2-hydroxyglutarate dehydrogenase